MVVENPTWGAPRIHGELLMLSFDVSERTISRWMKQAPRDPKPATRWLAFLRNHREAIAAMDFFTVPTITFSALYCFFVISHESSAHPAFQCHKGNATPTTNHWLMLKLVGHKSNRDAIGTEVRVVAGKVAQVATVTTASSYLSSSDKRVHFGLGTESVAAAIEIRWPSGILQKLKNVRSDQILQVDEPLGSTGERRRLAQ